jgi:type I restriction-modification system DNA methylase subunit
MIDKLTAQKRIEALVNRFEEQYDSYINSNYNETQTRRDFIDPFFKALGWDIDNEQDSAEAYREVIHEDKVKISGATKAPDYSFRLGGGKRLFFVEAKKPSVSVKDDIHPAYQIRRYGWSAKLPISIITDFEEFAIYDCTKKPDLYDKASVARIKYFTFRDYLKEFDFIWETFSKEQVYKGSFDKFVQSDTHKKGTTSVDKEFLESLDRWRTYLAVNISWNNKNLDEDEINFAVQQTIDRLIFLRIAEDRSVEPYGNLKHSIKQGNLYSNLFEQFRKADEKYNSGLFDQKKDRISENLKIENKVIRTIINELYYPECPYEFSVLPVEILGSAYEQFLGKVIRITPAHHAKIEEKPEVRKAGGVYYTPQYIVDYIVKNTVGKLIEGKTPKEISKIKIVDPACGSGSFLIGAFQYLLDYHKNYYSNNGKPLKGKKDNPITPDGHLSTAEKRRILLNNIFGVDIDVNAVEVTKLSLLLKCMEGETSASIAHQLSIFSDRVLPTLDNNIKDGNSLIDIDFYSSELDFGFEKKIKPFNWGNAFPEVFRQDGFDIVIGNPPYVRQELLGQLKDYFEKHFKVYHGTADLYSYFIEKSIILLKTDGLYGVIVANKWMRANYGEPLREYLGKQSIYEIIDFGDLQIFENATTYPCILIAGKTNKTINKIKLTIAKTLKFNSLETYVNQEHCYIKKESLEDSGWNLANKSEQDLLLKIQKAGVPLDKYVNGKIFRGILTGLNEAFVIDEPTKLRLIKEYKRSAEIIKPFLAGKEIKMYKPPTSNKYLILFPKGFTNEKSKTSRNAWNWFQENYSDIANYLEPYKNKAEKRCDKGDYWWELRACDYYSEFDKPKIMLPDIALRMQATYDTDNFYCVNTAYIIPVDDKYLLALLNSNLINYFYSKVSSSIRGGYLRFIRQYLATIPITNNTEKRPELIKLVDSVLQLNKDLQEVNLSSIKDQLQSKIEYLENKINEIVYKLYGLTEDEIRIVEGK